MKKKDIVKAYLASLGRKGAKARAEILSPAERKRIAKKAALARWGDAPKPKRRRKRR